MGIPASPAVPRPVGWDGAGRRWHRIQPPAAPRRSGLSDERDCGTGNETHGSDEQAQAIHSPTPPSRRQKNVHTQAPSAIGADGVRPGKVTDLSVWCFATVRPAHESAGVPLLIWVRGADYTPSRSFGRNGAGSGLGSSNYWPPRPPRPAACSSGSVYFPTSGTSRITIPGVDADSPGPVPEPVGFCRST